MCDNIETPNSKVAFKRNCAINKNEKNIFNTVTNETTQGSSNQYSKGSKIKINN